MKLAEGRIWTGRQAKANGLVDELGTLEDAVGAAKVLAGMKKDTEMELLVLPRPRNFIDTLLESRSESRMPSLSQLCAGLLTRHTTGPEGLLPMLNAHPEIGGHVRTLGGFLQLRGEPVWALLPCRVEVK